MNIVFIETTNATPHLETSFELVLKHLKNGDHVHYYFVGHAVEYNEFIVTSLLDIFLPENKAASLVEHPNFKFYNVKFIQDSAYYNIPYFQTVENLKDYTFGNFKAGMSAYSSLISAVRCSSPSVILNQDFIKILIRSGIKIYKFSRTVFSQQSVDLAYLFNGRFAINRAILDAALEQNIEVRIHERGANSSRYIAWSFQPHDITKFSQNIVNAWQGETISDKVELAKQYFFERRNKEPKDWYSYTKNQVVGFLPVKKRARTIAYFSQSDDEYISVGDLVKWDKWPNQITAVQDLVDIVSRESGSLFLIIRLHPHLIRKDPRELDPWLSLSLPANCLLLLPDDPTDTYALIEMADVVVTCSSTVGIESVFWGTPSICLGPSLYSNLDAVYLPNDKKELEDVLIEESLEVFPERSLPYGFYMATFGELFLHYIPDSLFSGSFLGVNLQRFGLFGYFKKLRSMVIIP